MAGRLHTRAWHGLVGGAVLGLAWLGLAPAAGAAPPPGPPPPPPHHGPPAVLDVQATTTYGSILVATLTGAKFPMYLITSDHPPSFGCTTAVATTIEGTFPCTGPETLSTTGPTPSEWPALTTTGPPVAGPGVNRQLLGTVHRPGVGTQVTYNGHPLYFFSPPTTFFGEGFVETVLPLPPWHGLWDLVSASGNPATGQAVIEQGTDASGQTVVSVREYPGFGGVAIAAYDFCGGPPPGPPHPGPAPTSTCPAVPNPPGPHGPAGPHPPGPGPAPGPGTTTWIPVLTQGPPAAWTGVSESSLGTVATSQGTQVTYNGRPLYLYSGEMPIIVTGQPANSGTTGNGVGVPGPGGTAHLIALT